MRADSGVDIFGLDRDLVGVAAAGDTNAPSYPLSRLSKAGCDCRRLQLDTHAQEQLLQEPRHRTLMHDCVAAAPPTEQRRGV